MRLVLVIAAYNEADTIAPLTERLLQTLDSLQNISWKLIYVIEGTDDTRAIVERFAAQRPEIEMIYNPQPSGLGAAFRRGFDAVPADTDYVLTMDADLNHQPEEIPRMLQTAQQRHADIVIGSRRVAESTIEGMPVWKTTISRAVNRMMHIVMGLRVNDLTSGFRVYRASALRAISFENVGFAYLPEILISAAAQGFKVVEEPISFKVRPAGESKMNIAATSLSYLRLFATHSVGVSTWIAAAILLLGIGVRIAFCYPPHKYADDADALLAGMCAMDVMHGKLPLFFPGAYHLSSQSCYVTAAMFGLFGVNRAALAGTSIFYGILLLVFGWLALREAAGPRSALAGLLLLAFPPVQFWFVSYPPWGYTEVLATCALVLWLGFRLLRPALRRPLLEAFFFGFAVGFAFWTSPQTIMISVPTFVLVLWRRRMSLRQFGAAVVGGILALYPYLLMLVYRGPEPFAASTVTQAVSGWMAFAANARYFFSCTFPVLMFSQTLPTPKFFALTATRVAIVALGIITLCVIALRDSLQKHVASGLRVPALFPVFIAVFSCAICIASGAGSIRGWTVRYAAPIFLVIPLSATLLFRRVQRKRMKLLVFSLAAILAALQLLEYPLFQPARRRQQVARLEQDRALVAWLEQHGRDFVVGDYWLSYPLNFETRGTILAVPLTAPEDFENYEKKLQSGTANAALLDEDPQHLAKWVSRLGESGSIERINDTVVGFVLPQPIDAAELERIRIASR